MVKCPEENTYKEQLKLLGLFASEKRLRGDGHDNLELSHKESKGPGTDVFSLVTVTGPKGMAQNCDRRG